MREKFCLLEETIHNWKPLRPEQPIQRVINVGLCQDRRIGNNLEHQSLLPEAYEASEATYQILETRKSQAR